MSTPDYTTLARQFMDMWQQQMHQAMTEPGFVNAMMDGMNGAKKKDSREQAATQDRQPAPASESSDEQLDELTRRIRTLEKRVAELERERAQNAAAKPAAKKAKAAKEPAKKQPRKNPIRKRAIKPADKPKRATAAAKKPAAKRNTKPKRK